MLAVAAHLREHLTVAGSPRETVADFVDAVTDASEGETLVVLKAAEQATALAPLTHLESEAPKIVISRDGSDAAFSALAYGRLARKSRWYEGGGVLLAAPGGADAPCNDRGCASRSGELYVLRYEDLTEDFCSTLACLLAWLGCKHDRALLERIENETSFETRTGRRRGTPGIGLLRSGATGEWRENLDSREPQRAWSVAGQALLALGYSQDGEVAREPIGTMASEASRSLSGIHEA